MKRLFALAMIFAFAAFAQETTSLAEALRAAPADANLVLISNDGRIVGYSEDLPRAGLSVVLANDFRGEARLLITAADGSVTHEFRAQVNDGGVVTVDGRGLEESLGEAGFGPPTFVTTGPPEGVRGGRGGGADRAGEPPGPPQAGGAPGAGAGSDPPGGGRGRGNGGGDEDNDDDEDDDEDDPGRGTGRPDSAGPP